MPTHFIKQNITII